MSTDARRSIAKGSKSFYLASLFFSRKTREACWVLYRWCRYCDDQIDNGGSEQDLIRLRDSTNLGLKQLGGPPIFAELGAICAQYRIPKEFAFELLNGFEKDTRAVEIQTLGDLEIYAYQVAGVVGLMMAHIMGANMPVAASSAKSLGNAMQLTNIARDIREDYERGRIYLPNEWLKELGIDKQGMLISRNEEKVFQLVRRLLNRADELYAEGYAGLRYLPFRSAVAVSIAGSVYSSIGRKILRAGPQALHKRVYVSLPEKLLLTVEGLFRVFRRVDVSIA